MPKNQNQVVKRVWERKSCGQKLVTIPKNSEIEEGDYVIISKLNVEKARKIQASQ